MAFIEGYTYFIVLSWVVSLFVYKKNFPLYLKLLSPFLLLAAVTEVYANYLYSIGHNNNVIYNFFSAFEFCFYLLLIHLVIKDPRIKKLIILCIYLYGFLAVLNILFIQGIHTFHSATYSAGCLLLVMFCIYYFYELFKMPESGKLEYNPAFWICTGLLFFYCCSFPLYAVVNLWGRKWDLMLNSFIMIMTILNIFLYSLFSIAFLCTKTRKYTLLSS